MLGLIFKYNEQAGCMTVAAFFFVLFILAKLIYNKLYVQIEKKVRFTNWQCRYQNRKKQQGVTDTK